MVSSPWTRASRTISTYLLSVTSVRVLPHIYMLLVTSMSRNLHIYMLLVTWCYATSKTSIFIRVSSPWAHASRTISIYMFSVTLFRVLPHIYMLLVTSMSRNLNIYMLLVARCYTTSKTSIFTRVSSPWAHASRAISIYTLSVTLVRVLPHIYMLLVTSMSRNLNIYMLWVTRCHATSKTSIFTRVSSPWVHASRTISIYMLSVTLVRVLPHIYMLLVTSMSRNLNIYMLCATPMSWNIKNINIYNVYRHPGFGTRCHGTKEPSATEPQKHRSQIPDPKPTAMRGMRTLVNGRRGQFVDSGRTQIF